MTTQIHCRCESCGETFFVDEGTDIESLNCPHCDGDNVHHAPDLPGPWSWVFHGQYSVYFWTLVAILLFVVVYFRLWVGLFQWANLG
ncbi:MAG: hypothetical protein KDA80_04205 [Planctomycetaceae bacterium]|nr:hypothetical protein [Planctomycetaceae bacterium]